MHKTANVLNKFPKSMAPAVKSDLRNIWQAETRAAAEMAVETFAEKYGAKYDKAVACLVKDREALLAFFDFPAEPGITCARQTRSRASSPRSGTGPSGPRGRFRRRRRRSWSSPWSAPPRRNGAGCRARTGCLSSSKASSSPTVSPPATPKPAPPDSGVSQHSAGLGLAIVERVARAHGGRLRFARPAAGGFEAALVLPAPAGAEA